MGESSGRTEGIRAEERQKAALEARLLRMERALFGDDTESVCGILKEHKELMRVWRSIKALKAAAVAGGAGIGGLILEALGVFGG